MRFDIGWKVPIGVGDRFDQGQGCLVGFCDETMAFVSGEYLCPLHDGAEEWRMFALARPRRIEGDETPVDRRGLFIFNNGEPKTGTIDQ